MMELRLPAGPLNVLCLGAHSDDIEIGAAGTLLTLLDSREGSEVTWVVGSAPGARTQEAESSASVLLAGLARFELRILELEESYMDRSPDTKRALTEVRAVCPSPDVVFTHFRFDRHQDHSALSDLTWQLWRDQLILEYEIPKWDGDIGTPNLFVPLAESVVERKLGHLADQFGSQRTKDWYDAETFRGLMRLRGMECRAPSRYAEAFHVRKLRLV